MARPRAVRLALDGVSFGERNGLFGVQELNGELAWDAGGEPQRSRLAWQGAHFHQLLLGAAALQLETGPDGLRIREPLTVPLLDGQLHVEEFELGRDEAGVRWLLEATRGGARFTAAPIGLYFARLWYSETMYPRIFTALALGAVTAGEERMQGANDA